jgi:hypothetical protein
MTISGAGGEAGADDGGEETRLDDVPELIQSGYVSPGKVIDRKARAS